jgi:hypothetical protein
MHGQDLRLKHDGGQHQQGRRHLVRETLVKHFTFLLLHKHRSIMQLFLLLRQK